VRMVMLVVATLFFALAERDSEIQYTTSALGSTQVDDVLRPYVDQFMRDCTARRTDCEEQLRWVKEIKAIDMHRMQVPGGNMVIGLCYINPIYHRVHINKKILHYGSSYVRAVVYHELGHCLYNLDHSPNQGDLMSEVIPDIFTLSEEWPRLMAGLFAMIEED